MFVVSKIQRKSEYFIYQNVLSINRFSIQRIIRSFLLVELHFHKDLKVKSVLIDKS